MKNLCNRLFFRDTNFIALGGTTCTSVRFFLRRTFFTGEKIFRVFEQSLHRFWLRRLISLFVKAIMCWVFVLLTHKLSQENN